MSLRPDIAAIVVTYNSKPFAKKCLEGINRCVDGSTIETIVVDNASADGSADIASGFPSVKVIRNRTNVGFARAVNLGLSLSDSKYVLLLNPDAVATGSSVQAMLDLMESEPDVACVAPQLLNFDGTIQNSCREFPSVRTILSEFFLHPWVKRMFPSLDRYRMGYFDHTSMRDVDQPMASCLLLRRDTLEKIGYLDESMPLFFNDVDLCRRIKKSGGRVVFLPSAKVYHYCGGSTRYMGAGKELHLARSMCKYMSKHSSAGSAYLSGLLLIVGCFIKAGGAALTRIQRG